MEATGGGTSRGVSPAFAPSTPVSRLPPPLLSLHGTTPPLLPAFKLNAALLSSYVPVPVSTHTSAGTPPAAPSQPIGRNSSPIVEENEDDDEKGAEADPLGVSARSANSSSSTSLLARWMEQRDHSPNASPSMRHALQQPLLPSTARPSHDAIAMAPFLRKFHSSK